MIVVRVQKSRRGFWVQGRASGQGAVAWEGVGGHRGGLQGGAAGATGFGRVS